jgi:ATP-binding cassette subfamily B protein
VQKHKESTPKKKTGLARLIEIAGAKKWWLFASMALAVVATLAQFVPMVAVYMIISELADHAADLAQVDRDLLYRLGFVSLGSVGVYGVFLYVAMMLSHIAAFNILYEIRIKIAEKLAKLSMGYFTRKASGEIKKVMAEDVERIELFVAHHIPDMTSAVVFPIIVIGYLFYMDWRLAIAALIPFPLAMGLMARMMTSPTSKKLYREHHDALEKMNAAVVEYVRGMPVIKVFGTALDSFRRLKESVISAGVHRAGRRVDSATHRRTGAVHPDRPVLYDHRGRILLSVAQAHVYGRFPDSDQHRRRAHRRYSLQR